VIIVHSRDILLISLFESYRVCVQRYLPSKGNIYRSQVRLLRKSCLCEFDELLWKAFFGRCLHGRVCNVWSPSVSLHKRVGPSIVWFGSLSFLSLTSVHGGSVIGNFSTHPPNQCCGSVSAGSVCFWNLLDREPDPLVNEVPIRILLWSSKISKKNLNSYCLVTSLWLFIFEKDVYVASKCISSVQCIMWQIYRVSLKIIMFKGTVSRDFLLQVLWTAAYTEFLQALCSSSWKICWCLIRGFIARSFGLL
jgi:hypothetical protein